jgi:hypothetical protein
MYQFLQVKLVHKVHKDLVAQDHKDHKVQLVIQDHKVRKAQLVIQDHKVRKAQLVIQDHKVRKDLQAARKDHRDHRE